MLKFKRTCRVCVAVRKDKVLLNRIYNTSFYMKSGGEYLKDVADDNTQRFSYYSLLNHCKKHQYLNETDFSNRHLRQIANQAEKAMLKKTIESKQVWDEVINQGMEKLQEGKMDMKTGDLLKAAKDKSDYEFRQKDQQLAMMEMVFHFASGENNREDSKPYDKRLIEGTEVTHYDPASGVAGHSETGTDGPGGIHYPPAWDAAAPGPNPLPT